MLVGLTKAWRKRAAAFVVALYALCLLAPTSVFAFADGAAKAHCLAEASAGSHYAGHHHTGTVDSGMTHEHTDYGTSVPAADDHGIPGQCCGLFCVTALAAPAFDGTEMRTIETAGVNLPVTANLLGLNADRIDRPPRVLPSL